MSNFNEVTVGLSPHDEECLIKGLIRDFQDAHDYRDLNIMGGSINLGLSANYDIAVDAGGEALPTNATYD